jgi:outer membrane biosynthesis protein TonB
MGAPASGTKAADQPAAETLLGALKTIKPAERRLHASVLNYWLSIRGDKEFPPLHDLDPLELSDAAPNSALLELISGGHDAEIRHLGATLRGDDWPEQIMDAPSPSILACIAKKLPIVAISRDFLAFEDQFSTAEGETRCWVTLLPLSAGGAWVDYVYALVSFETEAEKAAKPSKKTAKEAEPVEEEEVAAALGAEEADEVQESAQDPEESVAEEIEEPVAEEVGEPVAEEEVEEPVAELADEPQPEADEPEEVVDEDEEAPGERVASAVAKAAPGFSKLIDSIAGLTGFYGSQPVKVEPVAPAEPPVDEVPAEDEVDEPEAAEPVSEEIAEEPEAAEEAIEEVVAEQPAEDEPVDELPAPKPEKKPARASEGTLQSKLTDVRAKADEARMAKLRANAALYEGLGAAYDFALDAEEAPEEYLRLVEAQGLKIQLRSPMKPVVKLAFDGMCDDATIKQLEAVLAWAFDEELPRGTLAERIEAAGGIGPILNKKAA